MSFFDVESPAVQPSSTSPLNKWGWIAIAILGAVILSGSVVKLILSSADKPKGVVKATAYSPKPNISPIPSAVVSPSPSSNLVVDVTGAVCAPGVYTLPSTSRVKDALDRAGGICHGHLGYVMKCINMAQPLQDGQKIYIPLSAAKVDTSCSIDSSQAQGITSNTNSSTSSTSIISANQATAVQLEELPGIGAARAAAIIQNRPYSTIEEVPIKAKLSDSLWQKIKNKLSL